MCLLRGCLIGAGCRGAEGNADKVLGKLPIDGAGNVSSAIVTTESVVINCGSGGRVSCSSVKVGGSKAMPTSEMLEALADALEAEDDDDATPKL